MENISVALQPYKDVVGSIASVITIIQFFSGALICVDIYKKQSTKGVSSIPFIGGTVIGTLVLKYAILLQDKAMFQVNMAAIVLNLMYLSCYFYFSENKYEEVIWPSLKGVILIGLVLVYLGWEDPKKVEFRYGVIVTVLMLLLMASPLMEINEIIRKKDASTIPFPITFMAFFVCISWLVYGIILMNDFMIIQNFVGTFLCLIQLILYFRYPSTQSRPHED